MVKKKRKMYKEDKLMLVCEWDGCGEEQANPDVFTWHVGQHCNDAEVNNSCLIQSCGFLISDCGKNVLYIVCIPLLNFVDAGAAQSISTRRCLPLSLAGLWLQDTLL